MSLSLFVGTAVGIFQSPRHEQTVHTLGKMQYLDNQCLHIQSNYGELILTF